MFIGFTKVWINLYWISLGFHRHCKNTYTCMTGSGALGWIWSSGVGAGAPGLDQLWGNQLSVLLYVCIYDGVSMYPYFFSIGYPHPPHPMPPPSMGCGGRGYVRQGYMDIWNAYMRKGTYICIWHWSVHLPSRPGMQGTPLDSHELGMRLLQISAKTMTQETSWGP